MIVLNTDAVQQVIKQTLGIVTTKIESVWEPSEWSRTFRIDDAQGKAYFLKGTPRTRPEALVTQILHDYDPAHIPSILVADLLPDNPWRWFLLPDMGAADYDNISPENALQTAYALGQLQRKIISDKRLPILMPQCHPLNFIDIIQSIGQWIESAFPNAAPDLVEIALSILPARKSFFDDAAATLAPLPCTCIHGDLWSGNIAVREGNIALLDWGDTIWGTGTSSIVHFTLTLEGTVPQQSVWNAYAQGWQQPITDAIIQASQTAYGVSSLLVEQQLAQLQAKPTLPVGIKPLLQTLVTLSD